MAIQAIFFDIGDTLVFDDPPLRERLTAAAQAAGLSVDKARLPEAFQVAEAFAVRRYADGIDWDTPGALRETVDCLWTAMQQPPLGDSQWGALASAFTSAPFARYTLPQAAPLLQELQQRGFVLGAISDWEDTLPEVLSDLGLLPCFRTLSISAVVGIAKPSPRLFEDALDQTGLPPGDCLHIGDWYELDVCGARAAGMNALLFDWAGRRPDADCPRVTDWRQLTQYLRAL